MAHKVDPQYMDGAFFWHGRTLFRKIGKLRLACCDFSAKNSISYGEIGAL